MNPTNPAASAVLPRTLSPRTARAALGALLLLAFGSCAHPAKSIASSANDEVDAKPPLSAPCKDGPRDDQPYPVIDAHTHTHFTGELEPSSQVPVTRAEYLAEMKEAGIIGAVVHDAQDGSGYVDLSAHHVIHCGGVGKVVDVARLEAGLKSRKYRCLKIYLGYVHQFASSPAYEPAYLLAEKYDVPVVFHTGDTYSTRGKLKYADPLTIDEVAVDHPKLRIVIAHLGNPWIQSAAEVAYKNPNVWVDGSAILIGGIENTDPAEIQEYLLKPVRWAFGYMENPEKMLYGSDWPLVRMPSYVRAFAKAIPKRYWRQVFYENARKVFRLDLPPADQVPPRMPTTCH